MEQRGRRWRDAAGRLGQACAALGAAAVLGLLAALFAAAAAAQPVLALDAAAEPVPLAGAGLAWIDEDGTAPIATLATDPRHQWRATRTGDVHRIARGKVLWIRFQLAAAADDERWYLEIPYPAVDRVTLYAADRRSGQWLPVTAGDALPVADWPVPARHPVLPLALARDGPTQFLLRVENAHSFGAPLQFVSEGHLNRKEQRTALVLGMYFGLTGLAVLLAGIAAVSLRDAAFGWYALAITIMSLAQASITGLAGLHLWPRAPWWNDVSSLVLPVVGLAALMWFFSAVVSAPERSRRIFHLLAGMSALGVVVAAAVLLVEPSLRFRLMVPYIAAASAVAAGVVLWAVRRGDRHAKWLLAGLAPVIVAAVFPLARTAGLIPISFWTAHALQIGIAIEVPLLLMVLVLRSQHRRENSRRIQGMDRMDPATGLINGAVFEDQLARLIARSERLKFKSAVLLVDIVNADQVRRDFDRRAAEELPLLVAGRLLSAAREIDSVARLSERRFGMLVEGPLSPEEAASAGPRVVARCLMPFKDKPLEFVVQVRVAQTLVPTQGFDARRTLERLDAVLAAVPAESRRAVFTIR